MEQILARCGYRCDLCLAYRPNVQANPSSQQILSDRWHKYFGFRIPPGEVVCDGCMAEDGRLIDHTCPVRPCVIERALRYCAECADYGCEELAERLVNYEDVAARFGAPIPEEDRARFIAPYENKQRLEELRARWSE
ncbi:MAG: DUF3795 domain-containing protein [Armatimonadetes bacterium]|nr:DUF3795 domain-containing protein [Armatimonadota bacterium]